MGANYSTGSLARDIARLQSEAQGLLDRVEGALPDSDGGAQAAASDIIGIIKSIDSIRNDLRRAVKVLRRGARIILTLHVLAEVTGKSADPAAFIATCTAAELDQLVALRKANHAGCIAFYLGCHGKASTYKANP